jgi:rhodanese-related sulfurtransferase
MTILHRGLALVAGALACAAVIVDGSSTASSPAPISAAFITAPELAVRIMRRDPTLRVFDLRSQAEYERLHVPSALHVTITDLTREPLHSTATAVVYANTLTHATRALARLNERGVRHAFILRGGLYEWIVRIHEPRLAADATTAERAEFEQAVTWSRFFGGMPRENVPRSEIPTGHWSGGRERGGGNLEATLLAVAAIRRRGC